MQHPQNYKKLPKINIDIAGRNHCLYVASSKSEKKQGLSGVDDLPPGQGMIFAFGKEEPRVFQFRETKLPLVIYFINQKGKIVHSEKTNPGQEKNVSCEEPCMCVIEIVEG